MSLWRVILTVHPSQGMRKARVHEYVVLATNAAEAIAKATDRYRPDAHEVWTIAAESWDGDVIERRIFLEVVK